MRKRKPVLLNGEALMADGKVLEFDAVDQEELDGKIDAPQVANVGEVLTVEEVDEEGKPVKWKAAKISGTFVCTFTDADSGNGLICDKTEDEIDAASSKGDNIVGVYDSMVFQLSLIGEYKRFVCQEGRYVYSIYKETTDSNYIMESMFLSDIAPTDVPVAYEVPVSVPTNRGIQWQYGRPLLATDYLVNELTDEEKALMQKNIGFDDLSLVKYTKQELTSEEQAQVRENIGAKPIDFPVTITSTTTDGVTTYTADKTFVEIKTAYEGGANVYAVDSMEMDIFPLRDVDGASTGLNSFAFYGVRNNFKLGMLISIDNDDVISVYKYNLLTSENIKNYAFLIWETLADVYHSGSNCYGICKQKGDVSSTYIPDGVVFPVIIYVGTYSHGEASMRVIDADGVVWVGKFNYGTPKLFSSYPKLPSPATAQVGQIVKVKSVDESGKITETETVDMPSVSNDYELVFQETVAEDAASYSRDTDKDGNPFSLTDVMLIIFTKPFAESTNSAGRALGFLPSAKWSYDTLGSLRDSIKSGGSDVGRYEVIYAKVINNYQIVDKYYESHNTTNAFGVMMQSTRAGATGIMFRIDAEKLMEISNPQGNITCVKIVGYTVPLVSAGTIVALYKKKGT